METFDETILEFARRWIPYGGPPQEEILVGFGLTPERFAERALAALGRIAGRRLTAEEQESLRRQLICLYARHVSPVLSGWD
ncbi:hypothetical protein [Rhodococcus sp. NCIMB 12038]|uniref:hypothetical protein n=1 Tax=Rhodococcus sp. NCIMB 12038 TaxID=933800 RepID=UPI001179ACAA|nr:hypothetical protein [Rhodococcus sp. NCIMB 12038]